MQLSGVNELSAKPSCVPDMKSASLGSGSSSPKKSAGQSARLDVLSSRLTESPIEVSDILKRLETRFSSQMASRCPREAADSIVLLGTSRDWGNSGVCSRCSLVCQAKCKIVRMLTVSQYQNTPNTKPSAITRIPMSAVSNEHPRDKF
jgi:hypothetical protein